MRKTINKYTHTHTRTGAYKKIKTCWHLPGRGRQTFASHCVCVCHSFLVECLSMAGKRADYAELSGMGGQLTSPSLAGNSPNP